MATKTYHISLPKELAKEIDREIKKGYYTPSEYFKDLYRKAKQYFEYKDFQRTYRAYEKEKKAGTLKELKSVDELFE